MYAILWPERRKLTAGKVMTMLHDAIANGDVDPQDVDQEDPNSCARALHDAGLITLQAI